MLKEIESEIKRIEKIIPVPTKKRLVVYTSLFQSFEPINLPIPPSNDLWDTVVFHDGSTQTNSKEITGIHSHLTLKNPRLTAKYFKVNPQLFFQNYEFSLYIDANCILKPQITELLTDLISENISCSFFRHNRRNCAYQECKYIAKTNKESWVRLFQVWKLLKKENYPKANGLIQGGFIFRRHNDPKVKQLMRQWWRYIEEYSERDQLFLNYAAWELDFDLHYIEKILHESPFTTIVPHRSVRFNSQGKAKKDFFGWAINKYFSLRQKNWKN